METSWSKLISQWTDENAIDLPTTEEFNRYRRRVKRKHLLYTVHWYISKLATLAIYLSTLHMVVTDFSQHRLAFMCALAIIATTATFTNDPKFLGLSRHADLKPEDYFRRQNQSIGYTLRSVVCNLVVYLMLLLWLYWVKSLGLESLPGTRLSPQLLLLGIGFGVVFELSRWKKARATRSRLEQLSQSLA